jgi:hypothetical protein
MKGAQKMKSVKVLFLVALIFLSASVSQAQTTTWQQGIVMDQMEMMPVAFTENRGQLGERTLFKGQIGGATFYFSQSEVVYLFIRETNELIKEDFGTMAPMSMTPNEFDRPRYKKEALLVKAQFVGANLNARIIGGDKLAYNSNYFLGNDPTKWRTDVPNYKSVIYKDVYPGIDLKYYGTGRSMKYDFIVNPGGDISKIKIRYEGVQNLSITAPGDLVAQTNFGPLHEKAPVIYQEIGGIKKQVEGRYEIKEPGVFGFALNKSYNQTCTLTIDPELVYGTFLGGTSLEGGYHGSIASTIDSEGSVYVMGNTESANLPVSNFYDGDYNGAKDIFVAKFSSAGNSLLYCTYLGGTGEEEAGYQMAVDADGNAYVTGHTASSDFPTINAYDSNLGGDHDIFVAKLSNLGNSLLYSTYLGGSSSDFLGNVTVDQTGNAYVTGQTWSTDFPMVNPYQPSHIGGEQDAFIAKLSPTGSSLLYSTYLGGSNADCGFGIAIDQANNIYVTGRTWSSDFPTANAYQNTFGGSEDGFVAKLSTAGNSLVYSTYLGGGARDGGCAIALDDIQNLYMAGWTQSSNFPTVNPFDRSLGGTADAIIAKFSPSGSLLYSTYLGGSDVDQASDIVVDSAGNFYLTGETRSNDFHCVNSYDNTYSGTPDAFVAKLTSSGHSVFYTTYLGGTGDDMGRSISVDTNNNAYVAGYTFSSDFPTVSAFDSTYNGGGDAFVTKIWDESPPVPFPNISVADTFHFFSTLKVGETEDWTFIVRNTGDGDLVIDSTTDSSISGNGGFSVVSPSFPQTVPPGDSLSVVLRFSPSGFGGYGSYMGEIRIWSNDWDQPKVSVWLYGQKQWEYIFVYVIGNSGTGLSASVFYSDLPETLSQDGRDMWVEDRVGFPSLTDMSPYISFIDQIWIVSGESTPVLTPEEIQLLIDFHNSGKGILVMGDGCNYNAPANQLASALGVEFVSSHCCDCDHCGGPIGCPLSTSGFTPHAIWNNVSQIQANHDEGDLSATSPAQIIASHNGINMVAVREGDGGRVGWDASFYRFSDESFNPDLAITHYDNAQYVRNLANWLAGGGQPSGIGAVAGRILDVETGQGIEGVTVYIQNKEKNYEVYALTSEGGRYEFGNVPFGTCEIWPVLFGYVFSPLSQTFIVSDQMNDVADFQATKTGDPVLLLQMRTWEYYKNNFVTAGRVKYNGDSTCSEAQSYLMLRSYWMNDQPMFDRAWEWTRTHLQRATLGNSDSLFAWLWCDTVLDQNSATDGDIDIALALALAAKSREWIRTEKYKDAAIGIIRDIWDYDVASRPVYVRGIDEPVWIMTAGWSYGPQWDIQFDPSYFSPHAYKIFSKLETECGNLSKDIGGTSIFRAQLWKNLVCDTYKLLSHATQYPLTRKPPDGAKPGFGVLPPYWVFLREDGNYISRYQCEGFGACPNPDPDNWGPRYNYDAFRTFWRIALDYYWHSQDENARTYLVKTDFPMTNWRKGELKSIYEHDGHPVSDYLDPIFCIAPLCQLMALSNLFEAYTLFNSKFWTESDHWDDWQGNPVPYYQSNWMWFGVAFFSGTSLSIPKEYQMNLFEECGECYLQKLEFISGCPVDLHVIRPDGSFISKQTPNMPWGTYTEIAVDSLGTKVDYVALDSILQGAYQIMVIPECQDTADFVFSLRVRWEGQIFILADSVLRSSIPENGYLFSTLPFTSLFGFVRENISHGLFGVNVDIYDSTGTLWQSVVTNDSGYYHIDSIPNGNYSISVVTPLGYQADQETKELTINHVPVRADFSLTKLSVSPRQRSRAYWVDQLCRALQNKPKDYTRADFSCFAGLINYHFNQNQVNPVDIYTVPQPANQNDSLMVMKKILTMCNNENEPFLKRLAKAQLMALVLNVVSGKIHQTQTISADNRTVSQAITFCDQLIGGEITCPDNIPGHNNPNCPYILSDLILNLINVGATVPRNLIPANVIQIAYDIHISESVPEHFALNQNYPNPFNPMCEISYALPTDCHVTLTIYNVLGQRVKVLVDEYQNAGNKTVSWDSKDDQGQEVTSGIYFYRIKAGDFVQSKKMVLLR